MFPSVSAFHMNKHSPGKHTFCAVSSGLWTNPSSPSWTSMWPSHLQVWGLRSHPQSLQWRILFTLIKITIFTLTFCYRFFLLYIQHTGFGESQAHYCYRYFFICTVTQETYSCFQCPASQQQTFLSHRWQWLFQKPSVSQSCYIPDTSSLHPCHLVEPSLPVIRARKRHEWTTLVNHQPALKWAQWISVAAKNTMHMKVY